MFIHLGLHHFLDGTAKKILECILNILGTLDVILLEELLDDSPLSLSHLYFVNVFSLFCHNKRPPMIKIVS